jgi:hypothetical protein
MIDRRRSLAEDGRVASQSNPGRQNRIGQKLAQQYRPIAVQAIAAAMPYQGQRKNAANAPAASRHKRRTPSETD